MKFLLIVLLLASCATAQKDRNSTLSDSVADIQVSNEDFKKKPLAKFNTGSDYYKSTSPSALRAESASRVGSESMKAMASGGDDLARMISLCYEKKFSEAFKLADSLFFTYQKHPSYWNQLASCYLIQGVERKAMLFFNKALEVMPMYVPALNNIGVIYHMNGQDQKSLVALEKALSQSKFSKTPRYNLAFLYLQYGLAIKAKDLFAGLVEESPADVEVRSGLANSYAMLKNWDSAIEEFMKIPDAERGRPEIGLNFSLAAYYSGKRDLALSIFKAVKVSPAYRAYANVVAKEIGESL